MVKSDSVSTWAGRAMQAFVADLYLQGMGVRQIAEVAGRSESRVRKLLAWSGVRVPSPQIERSRRRRAEVLELAGLGWPVSRIAVEVGLSQDVVSRHLRGAGIRRNPVARPFTEEEAARARRMLEDGVAYDAVAKALGRSYHVVRRRVPGFPVLSPSEAAERAVLERRMRRLEREKKVL